MRETSAMSSSTTCSASPSASQRNPSKHPMARRPRLRAAIEAAAITALIPGAGPPPTRIASVFMRPASSLHPLDGGPAEHPVGPREQHYDEHEVGGDIAESAAQEGIEVARRQALQHAHDDGADDDAVNAVEAADDHDGKHLEPDDHHAESAAGHECPQRAREDGDRPHHRPRDREVTVDVD